MDTDCNLLRTEKGGEHCNHVRTYPLYLYVNSNRIEKHFCIFVNYACLHVARHVPIAPLSVNSDDFSAASPSACRMATTDVFEFCAVVMYEL